jgi:gliding motility-associated-like protein
VVEQKCFYPYVTDWFCGNFSTPDYFESINQIGLILYFNIGIPNNDYREIIGSRLKKKLNPDHLYRVQMKFERCGYYKYTVNRIGVLFSKDSISNNNFVINNNPQIEVDTNFYYDGVNIIDTFFSPMEPDNEFIYVGNFYSDARTKIEASTGVENVEGYYLVDYVNVFEVDTTYKKKSINDTAICIGSSIKLSNSLSRNWRNYSWYTNDGFVSNNLNITVSPTQTTKYYLYTTDTIHAPHIRLDSVTVVVLPYAANITDRNLSLCSGDTVKLNTEQFNGYAYKWQPSQYLNSDTLAQPYLQIPYYLENEKLVYIITVTNKANNCDENFNYTVNIEFCPDSLEPQIYIPNIFTPNGNGDNDVYKLSAQNIKNLNAEIYNRWGIRINSFTGTNGFWDGTTIAGEKAPEGIYYITINADGMDKKTHHYSGYVQLVR